MIDKNRRAFFAKNHTSTNALILEYVDRNFPVGTPNNVSDWNGYFFNNLGWDETTLGGSQFTKVSLEGSRVKLYGGYNIIAATFNANSNLRQVFDYVGCILESNGNLLDSCVNAKFAQFNGLLTGSVSDFNRGYSLDTLICDNLLVIQSPTNFFSEDYVIKKISFHSLKTIPANVFDPVTSSLEFLNIDSVGTIPTNFFSGSTSIISLYSTGSTRVRISAFEGCTSLANIDINSATQIDDNAFRSCTSLNTTSNVGMGSATTISDYAFASSSMYYVPSTTTTIRQHAFEGCTISSAAMGNLTTLGRYAFYACPNLSYVSAPILVSAEEHEFAECTNLVEVVMNNLLTASAHMFESCSLTNLDGNQAYSSLLKIEDYSFATTNLTSTITTAPLFDTVLEIGQYSFAYCPLLSVISFENVDSIGDWAFASAGSDPSITDMTIYLPNCKNLGSTTGDDNVFRDVTGKNITATFNSILQTNNGGNEDGDIQYLIANNLTVNITWV